MSNHFSAAYLHFPGDDTRLELTDLYAFTSADGPAKTALIIDVNPTVRPPIELPPTVITSREFHPARSTGSTSTTTATRGPTSP